MGSEAMLPKTKPRIVVLLAFLLCLGMIIPPVCAASYTLTGYMEYNIFDVQKEYHTNVQSLVFDKSAEDQAITLVHFKCPQDHQIDFTIYYGIGSTVSGSVSNVNNWSWIPPTTTTSTISFDGVNKSYSYFDTNPSWDYYLSGYARDNEANTTGLIVYNAGYGSFDNDLAVYKAVPNIASNLIYRVDLSSDTVFDVDISYGTKSDVAASVSKTPLDVAGEWLSFAMAVSASVMGFILSVIWILKFFFIDHLLLVIALWLGVSMAYSAISTRDIFQFYKKFFRFQRALLDFIVGLWDLLVRVVGTMVQTLLKWL